MMVFSLLCGFYKLGVVLAVPAASVIIHVHIATIEDNEPGEPPGSSGFWP